ncbi:MAG: hypothetical protein JSV33_15105 [bacterium]|nr:MAG: hypothetical protein JSV33_15105 [bacterium]
MKFKAYVKCIPLLSLILLLSYSGCGLYPDHGPYNFQCLSPTHNSTIYADTVQLRWYNQNHESEDGIQPRTWYDVYIGTTLARSEMLCVAEEYEDREITVRNLLPNTRYWWSVVAHDENGYTNSWQGCAFWTGCFLYPYDPSPFNGAPSVNIGADLSWSICSVPGETYGFDVYFGISTDPELVSANQSEQTYDPGILDYETTYYWKIFAFNEADTAEGPLWQFTTMAESEAPTFTLLEVDVYMTYGNYHYQEEIRARFDMELALTDTIRPLQADSVFVEDYKMWWNQDTKSYSYVETSLPFIDQGERVDFVVFGNSSVPDLNSSIVFDDCVPILTYPQPLDHVSINGFDVHWDNSSCSIANVTLTLMKYDSPSVRDSTDVWITTTNDGFYTFTADDLAPLNGETGQYDIIIIEQTVGAIVATGYMPGSIIRTRAYHMVVSVYLD